MENTSASSPQEYFDSVVFCRALEYVVPSLISAISNAIVIIVSISGKFWTRPLATMIFAINLGDFIYFIPKASVLVHDPDSDLTCLVMQAISMFGIILAASWAPLFGHAFYTVLKEGTMDILSRFLKYYVAISLVLPLVVAPTTFVTKNIRLRETGVCVYRVYIGEFDLFMFFRVQLPVTLAIFLCILFYILSLLQLRKIINKIQMAETLTLMMYPAILVICWTPLIGMQVAAEFGASINDSTAKTIRIVTHLMGFFDAIVYGEGMKGTLRNCLKACQKKKEQQKIDSLNDSSDHFDETKDASGQSIVRHSKSQNLFDSPKFS